eukprot:1117109-Rhodomonas_salina.2
MKRWQQQTEHWAIGLWQLLVADRQGPTPRAAIGYGSMRSKVVRSSFAGTDRGRMGLPAGTLKRCKTRSKRKG